MQNSKEQVDFLHLKEFGGLELLKAKYLQTQFSKHVHEGYCIGVIEEGAQCFYRTDRLHVAPKGEIILVNADEIHTGSSAVETGWGYRAIYPTPEMLADISLDFFKQKNAAPWFPDAVVNDQGLAAQLCLLFDLLAQKNNTLLKESMYISTLAHLMHRHAKAKYTPLEMSDAQKKVQMIHDLILNCPENDYSLTELAEMAGLSSWHLLRQFKKTFGLPPHAWLIQTRLIKAKKLMKNGESIASTALGLGFSDQSHFNRHFKKAMGLTPAQYISALKS